MELTLSEIKPIVKYIIENNQKLQAKGEMPIACNICGQSGIGKSMIIKQLANELNANFVKINTSNITEPSDLVGYPQREYYVCREDGENTDCRWITVELLEVYQKMGYTITDETRMGYAIPAWLKTFKEGEINILLIDDWTRSTPAIINALYEIIYQQEYISWRLPSNTHILLSANPDDGSYTVTSIDEAASSRMITFDVKFSAEDWAAWAENKEIDGRGISFLLAYHHELMDRSKTKCSKVNARNYTMFINTISGIKDWSNPKSLATILQIASGCFIDEQDIVGGLFAQFIANKLDRLISPDDLIQKDWTYVKTALLSQVYDDSQYRADIASIITTRFVNYSLKYFGTKGSKTEKVVNRLLDIVDSDKLLLTEDLIFSLIKTLNANYPSRCNKLLLNPKIAKKLIN